MTKVKIREMRSDETPLLVKWLYAHREVSKFEPEVFRKNQVKVFVAENETGILCFIPVKYVYMFEALAPNPVSTSEELSQSFAAMHEYIIDRAKKENVERILVQPSDEYFAEFIMDHFKYSLVTRKTLELNFNKVAEPAKCV